MKENLRTWNFYHYRFNPNGIINTSSNGMDIFRICDIVENFLKTENYYDEFENEFVYFKITQIMNYMETTNSEEYFQFAKKEFLEIDKKTIRKTSLPKYNLVVSCNSFDELKLKKEMQAKINKLSRQNKKLKKEIKDLKKQNESLLKSRSWKVTKPLRSFKKVLK